MDSNKDKKPRKPRKRVPLFIKISLKELCSILERDGSRQVTVSRNFILQEKEDQIRRAAKESLDI